MTKIAFIIGCVQFFLFSSLSAQALPSTLQIKRDDLKSDEGRGVVVDLETAYAEIENDYADGEDMSIFKIKPTLAYETESLLFKGFVPFLWVTVEDNSLPPGENNKDPLRWVSRPDLSGHLEVMDGATVGLGTKLPMFSSSFDGDGFSKIYATTQIYVQGNLRALLAGTSSFIIEAKVEKDLDKSIVEDGGRSRFNFRRGTLARGYLGIQNRMSDDFTIGSVLNLVYNIEATKSRLDSLEDGENGEWRTWGATKYSALEVFGDYKFSANANLRAGISKALTTSVGKDGSPIQMQNIDEMDKVADLAFTLNLMGRF